jgi:hypothetical protein
VTKRHNDAEFIKKIREVHDNAIQEKEKSKINIEQTIADLDTIELLAHISFISQYVPEDGHNINQSLREYPSLHFIAGLCLKKQGPGTRPPKNEEIESISENANRYFTFFMQDISLQSFKKEDVADTDGLEVDPIVWTV